MATRRVESAAAGQKYLPMAKLCSVLVIAAFQGVASFSPHLHSIKLQQQHLGWKMKPLASSGDDGEMSWQESLESLLNPFDTNIAAKQIMFQDLLARREDVMQDVSDSLAAGTPEELFPPNSELRLAAKGAKAVQRQLTDDVLPTLLEDAPGVVSSLIGKVPAVVAQAVETITKAPGGMASFPPVTDLPKLLSEEAQNVVSSMPVGLETPEYVVVLEGDGFEIRDYEGYAIASTGVGVRKESKSGLYTGGTFEESTTGDEDAWSFTSAQNTGMATGSTAVIELDDSGAAPPAADDSWFGQAPGASSVGEGGDGGSSEGREAVELVFSAGEGFQRLAAYVFGENDDGEQLRMTTPVLTSYLGKRPTKMSVVLPKSLANEGFGGGGYSDDAGSADDTGLKNGPGTAAAAAAAAAAPRPTSSRVVVSAKMPTRVAVKGFQGFATPGEIRRQLMALKESLGYAGLAVEDDPSGDDAYSVLQYNSPLTLPFLRKNEIMVPLRSAGAGTAEATAGEEAAAEEGDSFIYADGDDGMPSD